MKIVNDLDELMSELGIKPGDSVNILTPQFEREYDLEIKFIPKSEAEFNEIKRMPKDILKKMGVRIWEKYEEAENDGSLKPGDVHYLYPGEWYDHIPNGFNIISIFGKGEKFLHGESDDDIRFGCLPFGFIRNEQ